MLILITSKIAFDLGDSKAKSETFISVLKRPPKKTDNSDPNTADMRKLINFCLLEVSQYPTSNDAIVKIRDADLKHKVSQHRSNIFYDSRGRAAGKYNVSKALENLRSNRKGGAAYMM